MDPLFNTSIHQPAGQTSDVTRPDLQQQYILPADYKQNNQETYAL